MCKGAESEKSVQLQGKRGRKRLETWARPDVT